MQTDLRHCHNELLHAVQANVRASVNHLRHRSEVLAQLIQKEGLQIVKAAYSVDTGTVEFSDGVTADLTAGPRRHLAPDIGAEVAYFETNSGIGFCAIFHNP